LNYRAYGQAPRPSFDSSNSRSVETKEHLQYERRSLTDFATRGSRKGFIRKVYSIFCAQMVCTIAITSVIMNDGNIQNFLLRNFKAFLISAYLISTGVIVALVSNPRLRYIAPVNFVLLGLHTVMQSILVGIFSSAINPRLVCLGTIHTLGTFLAITLYSFQPNEKFDLTNFGNVLLTGSSSLLVGIVLNFFLKMPLIDNIISGALAVLFASYMAFDTQKIVGGKHHKYSYSQKEYILAALNLYQDVINFFMQIVSILTKLEKRNNNVT
jgi:protein lifeguard